MLVFPTDSGELTSDQRISIRMIGLLFGYPWISLGIGVIFGTLQGIWTRQQILRNIDDRVYRRWLMAQGRKREALQGSKQYRVIAVLILVFLLISAFAYVFGLSIKPLLHGVIGMVVVWSYPAERQVYAGTISRLHSSEFDDSTRVAVIRWEKRQKQTAFLALCLWSFLIAAGAYLFVSGSLEMRGYTAATQLPGLAN